MNICMYVFMYVFMYKYIYAYIVSIMAAATQVQHLVREGKKTRNSKIQWLKEMKARQTRVPLRACSRTMRWWSIIDVQLVHVFSGQELLSPKLLEKKFVRGKKSSSESLESSPGGDMLHMCLSGVCLYPYVLCLLLKEPRCPAFLLLMQLS